MQPRSWVLCSAVGAAAVGFAAGYFSLQPLLSQLFPAFVGRLAPVTPEQTSAAALQAGIALALVGALIPTSALVTEKFTAKAKYLPAIAKSLAVLLLVLIIAAYYQSETLASQQRVFDRMPSIFGGRLPDTQLASNPLTRTFWAGVLFLLAFGPLDLWIARQQLQYRNRGRETVDPATAPGSAPLPSDS